MKLARSILFALLLAAPAAPVAAETSLTAYDAARQALLAIWTELPLTARNVTLIDGTPESYGNYTAHQGNSYRPGEPIHIYVELLGYGFKDNGDGTFSKQFDADLSLIDASGTTVAAQEKFFTSDIRSREKLLETYFTFDATLTSFAPGAYKLHYVLHDRASGKQATFEVPITLMAADASAPSGPAGGPSEPSSSAAQ
ncbi:MAG TPA: hypothetical protein VHA10_07010 [Hypericibacter adhaerens]|uniref:hypothetical protein n=1 Tax=Hypericibacter adhaerens TaxID=2602016 RepID=UPI002C5D826D|nr:hypothetical protein [Hypericibacter adhaerens]HWA42942.1 hypothetical protein [Hypericibacter adhaerens]